MVQRLAWQLIGELAYGDPGLVDSLTKSSLLFGALDVLNQVRDDIV